MKKVLLIAGGGTLGMYTAKELIRLGHSVDVICLEDHCSNNPNLKFIKKRVDFDFLNNYLSENKYDGIVNFFHYPNPDDYKKIYKVMSNSAKHIIFLSSYRVYSDLEQPIVETSPRLFETVKDENFLNNENYAVPKTKCEIFLKNEAETKNWTIARPVISFSSRRLDIVTISGNKVVVYADENKPILLPEKAKNLTAGLDWAGNSGKIIANLLFKEKALGEAFTISSAQNLTWGDVAEIYTEILGVKFEWVDTNTYLEFDSKFKEEPWGLVYDRLLERKIDNSKVLSVTGLKKNDFVSIKDGIIIELNNIKKGRN